jgi:uncharacterized protein
MKENPSINADCKPDGLNRVAQAWENRDGPAVSTTVDTSKKPNAIYVPGEGFIIADNFFSKTRANIKSGTCGAILFLAKYRKSFQVKGPLTYHTEGTVFENMQSWHNPKYPGVAATLLQIEEAYSGAEKLFSLGGSSR